VRVVARKRGPFGDQPRLGAVAGGNYRAASACGQFARGDGYFEKECQRSAVRHGIVGGTIGTNALMRTTGRAKRFQHFTQHREALCQGASNRCKNGLRMR